MDINTLSIGIIVGIVLILIGLAITKLLKRSATNQNPVSIYAREEVPITKSKVKSSPPNSEGIEKKKDSKVPVQIFISYRRDDSSDITGRIYDRLVQHFGTDKIFKDVDSIPLGVDFKKHLDTAVARCSIFLIVIGPNWLYSNKAPGNNLLNNSTDFVRIELQSAFQREIPIIPLFVRKAAMPSKEDLSDIFQQLIYRNGINIRPDPDFHNDIDRLIRAIETHPQSKGNA